MMMISKGIHSVFYDLIFPLRGSGALPCDMVATNVLCALGDIGGHLEDGTYTRIIFFMYRRNFLFFLPFFSDIRLLIIRFLFCFAT